LSFPGFQKLKQSQKHSAYDFENLFLKTYNIFLFFLSFSGFQKLKQSQKHSAYDFEKLTITDKVRYYYHD